MIVIGLTGSIGMGKTTAAFMLADMGVPVHGADLAVHELLASGGTGVAPVAAAFPEAYDRKTDSIDRARLGDIVFNDPEKRERLENILHPLVRDAHQAFLAAKTRAGARGAVLDIPLLFETGGEQRVDVTIVVTAPAFIQHQRVMARPNMTAEKFQAILDRQMDDGEKRNRADYVVQTGLGRAYTRHALKKILRELNLP